MTTADDDVLAAALIQIAAHAEQITGLDHREASHHQHTTSQLGRLAERADSASTRIDAHRQHPDQPRIRGERPRRARPPGRVARTPARRPRRRPANRTAGPTSRRQRRGGGTWPTPNESRRSTGCAPGSSRSTGPATAISPPRCRPAGNSTRCACTPWTGSANSGPSSTSNPERSATTLAAQAEWQTRLLPAAADQMAQAAASCQHTARQPHYPPPPHGPFPGRGPAPRHY